MTGMNGMNFHSSGMILNVSEWEERQFHDVINCTHRLTIDLSQTTRRQLHDVSLSSRQLIQTSAVFSVATIGRARQQHAGVSAAYQRLVADSLVIQMPINRRSKEIGTACAALLCDRSTNRSLRTNTDVALSLFFLPIGKKNWELPTCRCSRFLCDFSLNRP